MQDLLFLCHRIPYPPTGAETARIWQMLRHLAGRYAVHLGCWNGQPADRRHEGFLQQFCASAFFAGLLPPTLPLRALEGLVGGVPMALTQFQHPGMRAWIDRVWIDRQPTRVLATSPLLARHLLMRSDMPARRVIDMSGAETVRADRGGWRWLQARDIRNLIAFERKVAGACDAVIFEGAEAVERFQAAVPEAADRAHHIAGAINSAVFSPRRRYPNPFSPSSETRAGTWPRIAGGRMLLFAGPLSERASADAAVWFIETVLPRLRTVAPECRLVLAGTAPLAILRQLADRPGILLIDEVADIRPYLAHVSAVVAPQRGPGGPCHELLAAMAMACPVVATREAAGDCGIVGMRELWLADEAEQFAQAVLAALSPSAGAVVGRAARARVEADFDWERSMARLEAILEGAPVPAAPARAQHRTAP